MTFKAGSRNRRHVLAIATASRDLFAIVGGNSFSIKAKISGMRSARCMVWLLLLRYEERDASTGTGSSQNKTIRDS